jgi:hypothetical protein
MATLGLASHHREQCLASEPNLHAPLCARLQSAARFARALIRGVGFQSKEGLVSYALIIHEVEDYAVETRIRSRVANPADAGEIRFALRVNLMQTRSSTLPGGRRLRAAQILSPEVVEIAAKRV